MDDQRKRAYRWLLYQSALDTRPLRWLNSRWRDSLNLKRWIAFVRRARTAGSLADWLHNLAQFSALDFHNFNEDRFWKDYEWFSKRYPQQNLENYRRTFDQIAASPSEGNSTATHV